MRAECEAGVDDLDGDDAMDDDENSNSEWLMKFQRRLGRSPAQVVRNPAVVMSSVQFSDVSRFY